MLPYLLLSWEDSAYREHYLRVVFNRVRYIVRTGKQCDHAARLPSVTGDLSADAALDTGRMFREAGRRHSQSAVRVCRAQGAAGHGLHR